MLKGSMILFGLLIAMFSVYGQTDVSKLKDLDIGVDLLEAGKYTEADVYFRKVLKNIKVLPTNLSYYFGKNSFYLNKYKQSIDWLNKYIELEGTRGRFFSDAVEHLNNAEAEYRKQRETEIQKVVAELSTESEIDCGISGKVKCPVCLGQGVIIREGTFGNEYTTCPFSDDQGKLTCEEYNLLIRGKLKPKIPVE